MAKLIIKPDIVVLYEEGKSIPDIAKIVNFSRSNVRYHLVKLGVKLRTRAEGMELAKHKTGQHLKGKKRKFSKEHVENMKAGALRRWDGNSKGTRVDSRGYIEFTTGPNKGRLQHVVLIEELVGRRILKNETVHHKNGVRTDNRLENLKLMTRSEHAQLHAFERIKAGTNYDISQHSKPKKTL